MIDIVEYQERWPHDFRGLAGELRARLGAVAVRIDHIGSTSVPGLAAKDVIDIQVTVDAVEPDDAHVCALQAAGHRLRDGVTRDHRPPRPIGCAW